MVAAITAILGALTALVPAIINFFELKENNAQAVRMEELRQKGRTIEGALAVDKADVEADARQREHIYSFADRPSGYKFVDALAVFVRPYVTLVFFHLWVFLEVCLVIYGINSGYDLGQLVKLVWSDETAAIFGAIMGFWFGDRMLKRGQQMAATRAVLDRQ